MLRSWWSPPRLRCPALDDLARQAAPKILVLRAGCSYRQRLEEILARRGVVGLRRLEFGTLEAILACTAVGPGAPRSCRAAWSRRRGTHGAITIHALPPAEARVETVLIRRHDAYVSSALAAFLRYAIPEPARDAA